MAEEILEQINQNDTYLIYQTRTEIQHHFNSILNDYQFLLTKKGVIPEDFRNQIEKYQQRLTAMNQEVGSFNASFIEKRMVDYVDLFNQSSFPLDENQKKAVIKDDKHNLIVAGAGSGKTEVLVTRIAYLIKRKPDIIHPDRILALAFQNKAAKEMRDRLKERFEVEVKIKTFHALGKEILDTASHNKNTNPPRLLFSGDNFKNDYRDLIDSIYVNQFDSQDFVSAIVNYLQYFGDDEIQKEEADFQDKQSFYEYMQSLSFTALNGTKVKSDAERRILNYFLTHSIDGSDIEIKYEEPAEWMSYTTESGNERLPSPDFYLLKYNVYLEHWGVNEEGNVPPWFEGVDPSLEYRRGMEAKKQKFASQEEYGLIETYQWELWKEDLDELLTRKLLAKLKERDPESEFEISRLPYNKIRDKVWEDCRKSVNRLSGHIADFIVIAKTYNLSPEDIERRLKEERWSLKQKSFGNVAVIIYKAYQNHLHSKNCIDFADMINLAVDALKENPDLLHDAYDHILVDEYQDISAQRYHIIRALMDKNPDCKLFCVGDDWQSIFGFAGSDVDYFVKFGDFFDHPERTDLAINYRSTALIVETGAQIIKFNEGVQLKKDTIAVNQTGEKPSVVVLTTPYNYPYYQQMAHHCVDSIEKLL
ncbi:UvrD-helicase domain-containing protein, partial [Methanocalculus sp.]|uniref:UvrD-helicase domain-containing protein n=1 Tax=Methanocalculus sp. TaxID=2004547 RepID=UPI0026192DD4